MLTNTSLKSFKILQKDASEMVQKMVQCVHGRKRIGLTVNRIPDSIIHNRFNSSLNSLLCSIRVEAALNPSLVPITVKQEAISS
jgi:hypothetical protein